MHFKYYLICQTPELFYTVEYVNIAVYCCGGMGEWGLLFVVCA